MMQIRSGPFKSPVQPQSSSGDRSHRDTQVVTRRGHSAAMNILLDCAWCGDEVVFSVDEADDELVCSACNTRTAFAPDPATTFALLYEAPKAA
jgi:DNA-directed RNA polymerase subunit RPC12/RpoP